MLIANLQRLPCICTKCHFDVCSIFVSLLLSHPPFVLLSVRPVVVVSFRSSCPPRSSSTSCAPRCRGRVQPVCAPHPYPHPHSACLTCTRRTARRTDCTKGRVGSECVNGMPASKVSGTTSTAQARITTTMRMARTDDANDRSGVRSGRSAPAARYAYRSVRYSRNLLPPAPRCSTRHPVWPRTRTDRRGAPTSNRSDGK